MNGRMAVIPTAAGSNAYNLDVWTEAGIGQVFHLHANDRDEANSSAFYSQLDDCTAVWFEGGSQRILEERYVRTATEEAFYRLLQRGGAIGGTSAGAAIQSKLMRRTSSGGQAIEGTGFDFLFGSYIDQHFWQRNRQPFAQQMLANNPGYLAFGIDENTALVVEGQKLTAISDPSQSGHHSVNIYLSSQTDPMNPDYVMNNGDTLDLVHLLNELKTR
jgi:cyanophycinase